MADFDEAIVLELWHCFLEKKLKLGDILLALLCTTSFCDAIAIESIPKSMNEQVAMIPVGTGWTTVELETTFFIPPGEGPFPLVIINHGKATGNPRFDPRARYPVVSREFLKRGYLVAIPMRPGFSKSGGVDVSAGCNSESYGAMQAEIVLSALGEIAKRPDVDPSRILVVGQSTGGLTVIASGTTAYPGVRGILNFAGGVRNTSCSSWEGALVRAFAAYGKNAKVASLWFYGGNDSYWGAELPKQMYEAHNAAGGKARLVAYGEFAGGDAHAMISSAKGVAIWWPETEKFLRAIGLPTEVIFEMETTPRPPKTDFAVLSEVSRVPYLDDRRRELYRKFLSMPYPRAFAIAPTGNVGWAADAHDPLAASLASCEKVAKVPCALYAVDDDVVWRAGSNAK
jgi:dienelactone hydrolase